MNISPILTSRNSPLRIGHLSVAPQSGAIGYTLCPGKWQKVSYSGEWQRDMATDIDAVRDWGAAAVVTTMPMDELEAVRAGGIGAACEDRGIEWYHLPITDVSVPDDAFETAWLYAGLRLRSHLRAGRNVLVHCRGGLGRSGTVAARLLVELGWEPHAAIRAVRTLRPGAIQTPAQERHVLRTRRMPHDESATARVFGCILGGAVGDAFGYAVEFDRWDAIRRKHGPRGLRDPVLHGGRLVVSDDTQMTLFTLEALAVALPEQGGPPLAPSSLRSIKEACRRAYVRWGTTQGITPTHEDADEAMLHRSPALRQSRAPGNTCLSAVRAGANGGIESPINDSKGCGAVMRTAPLGLVDEATPALALALGDAAGALTHGHIDGWLPAGALAALVQLIASGEDTVPAACHTLRLLAEHPHPYQAAVHASGTVRLMQATLQLLRNDSAAPEVFARLGEGWTGDEALAIGLWAACAAGSFEDAVRLGANHDGDSDSTASIAGQIHGARHGIAAVPHAWVRRIDVLDDALGLIRRFLEAQARRRESGRVSYGTGQAE